MSYFLGVAILPIYYPKAKIEDIYGQFGENVRIMDLSGTPFGLSIARRSERVVFSPVLAGGSTDLLGLGAVKQSMVQDLHDGLKELLCRYGGLAFAVHFFRGRVDSELVDINESRSTTLSQFFEDLPMIWEDVRYVVLHRDVQGT